MDQLRFTVIIVTYNRVECLKKALKCYDDQILKPECIIVVNNASTDTTENFLDEWEGEEANYKKVVINNLHNIGGAGGFATGISAGLEIESDFLFVADDDAYADPAMLKQLNDEYFRSFKNMEIAALCSSVVNYGHYDYVHRRSIRRGMVSVKKMLSTEDDYKRDYFEIDEFSFVGAAIKTDIARKAGIPRQDFFIYFDDTEYSHRIGQYGKIVCIPSSKMNHNVASGHDDKLVTWRSYYSLRNSLTVLKMYFPPKYFFAEAMKHWILRTTIFSRILKGRNSTEIRLLRDAINDAYRGRLGISDTYKPGSKLQK